MKMRKKISPLLTIAVAGCSVFILILVYQALGLDKKLSIPTISVAPAQAPSLSSSQLESQNISFQPETIINTALIQWLEVVPENAPVGSIPVRFWFSILSPNAEFYIEYIVPGIPDKAGMIFVIASADAEGKVHISRQSTYIQGEDDWILTEGEDARFIRPQNELYERNAAGEWVKQN